MQDRNATKVVKAEEGHYFFTIQIDGEAHVIEHYSRPAALKVRNRFLKGSDVSRILDENRRRFKHIFRTDENESKEPSTEATPSTEDKEFFLKILRRFMERLAADPCNKDLHAAARAAATVASAARGWQDNADLVERINSVESFIHSYNRAERVGTAVVRSSPTDSELRNVH